MILSGPFQHYLSTIFPELPTLISGEHGRKNGDSFFSFNFYLGKVFSYTNEIYESNLYIRNNIKPNSSSPLLRLSVNWSFSKTIPIEYESVQGKPIQTWIAHLLHDKTGFKKNKSLSFMELAA